MRRICAAIGIAVTASLVALSYDARTVSISKTRERDFELQLSTRNWRAGHETGLVTKGSPLANRGTWVTCQKTAQSPEVWIAEVWTAGAEKGLLKGLCM